MKDSRPNMCVGVAQGCPSHSSCSWRSMVMSGDAMLGESALMSASSTRSSKQVTHEVNYAPLDLIPSDCDGCSQSLSVLDVAFPCQSQLQWHSIFSHRVEGLFMTQRVHGRENAWSHLQCCGVATISWSTYPDKWSSGD